jgi:protein-S-isoprenylcysteine O-methyltransferase Ste14
MVLNEGVIIATLMTMGFTSVMRWLKDKVIKNPKIKYFIPNGFLLSLIFGLLSLFPLSHFNMLNDVKETIWDFLGAWVVIIGLSGGGKIAGQRLLVFVKAFLSDKETQIAQAELELKTLKEQAKSKKEKLSFLVEKKNGNV